MDVTRLVRCKDSDVYHRSRSNSRQKKAIGIFLDTLSVVYVAKALLR